MDVTETSRSQENILRQLQEKDQLVQTLTERLGEVAEQLDRARRSGSDKRGRATGASSEMLEQQRQLIENLSAVTEQWADVQPRDAFGRLEARLDHMRTLLESAIGSGLTPGELPSDAPEPRVAPTEQHSAAQQDNDASQAGDSQEDGNAQQDGEDTESVLSGWEAMKAQLLSGNAASPAEPASDTPPANDESPALEHPPDDDTADAPIAEPPVNLGDDVELPQPVDFESAGPEELEHAIDVRDHFIGFLTRRLRNEQHRTRETTDWEALNNAPEELRERLQGLEADLEDRLRIAEVELSLERARLSRVQSRTEEMQRQIEARMRSNRKANRAKSAEDAEPDSSDDPTTSKTWFSNLRRR